MDPFPENIWEEEDIGKELSKVQLDLGGSSHLSCDQRKIGETRANVLEAEVSEWVRIQKFWSGNVCFRKYQTQDERPHMEKADSRASPAVTH